MQANALERTGDLKRQRPVGGNNGFAHPAMAGMELAQGVVDLVGFVKRRFGIFGDRTGITRKRGAKCRQAVASGIYHAQRFAQKKNRFEALFDQVLGRGCGCLGVIQPDDIAGEFRDFTIDEDHGQGGLLQAVQALFTHAYCVNHNPFHLVAAQQVEVVQLLVDFVVGITDQRREALLAAGGLDTAEDVDGVGVGDIGDNKADQAGATAFEPARHQAGTIVEIGNGLFNSRQQCVGQQMFLAVKVARNAGFTGFGGFRHVADGGPGWFAHR